MLNNKLSAALAANATDMKNALETAVKNGGVVMTETDTAGHTAASDMEQGLYLVVETRVPENVTSTCNPFFVSLPMTTVDGADWNYDVTVYPKNQTGNPTLEKTVRESMSSTGKNNGSVSDITDGYAHTATASVGDTVEYQIISTLPTITSKASALTAYTYVDTMSKGIRYSKNDVVIEFFRDAVCTNKITTWDENSGKFTVAYDDTANTMALSMTESGLAEINESATVYTNSVQRGYSDCSRGIFMDKRFYRFLQATCCNWRNSFFIDCQQCDRCSGFLLSVNHNAVPTIIPVAVFEDLSGETVDKYDCVGIMTLEGFQRFYTSWLVWNVEDPKRCSLSQMWESCRQ